VFKGDFPSEDLLSRNGITRLQVVTRASDLKMDLGDALAGHGAIGRSLLDPDSGEVTPFPKARPAPLRFIASLGRGMDRNFNGTFGRRHVITHG
jgi:hypothetical protein